MAVLAVKGGFPWRLQDRDAEDGARELVLQGCVEESVVEDHELVVQQLDEVHLGAQAAVKSTVAVDSTVAVGSTVSSGYHCTCTVAVGAIRILTMSGAE